MEQHADAANAVDGRPVVHDGALRGRVGVGGSRLGLGFVNLLAGRVAVVLAVAGVVSPCGVELTGLVLVEETYRRIPEVGPVLRPIVLVRTEHGAFAVARTLRVVEATGLKEEATVDDNDR